MQRLPDVTWHRGRHDEHGGRGNPPGLPAARRGLRPGLRQRLPARIKLGLGRQELPREQECIYTLGCPVLSRTPDLSLQLTLLAHQIGHMFGVAVSMYFDAAQSTARVSRNLYTSSLFPFIIGWKKRLFRVAIMRACMNLFRKSNKTFLWCI